MASKTDQFFKFCLPVFIGLALRSAVILHPHSGQANPPMFGDYEAQRHWMEITTNLPPKRWYVNSTENDLLYWGLDYPPLTAYHSWFMGKLSEVFNPRWTALFKSRGMELPDHKVFMRYTVLLSDMFVFFPAVMWYFHGALPRIINNPELPPFFSTVLSFLYPGLILVDHGHFQYNCISLGFFLLSVCSFLTDKDILGSILFCLALGYKQMELYHALPIFFYLLGKCLHESICNGLFCLALIGVTVIVTMFALFVPFLSSIDLLFQVVERIFPLNRGIFEDKVANFWCVSTPLIKWRLLHTQKELVILCTGVVCVLCVPFCVSLLYRPKRIKLIYSLAICSLIFFLFSYQVHEKSILLAGVSFICLLPMIPISAFLFAIVSTLSMWPLFLKDGLIFASMCLLLIYVLVGCEVIFHRTDRPKAGSKTISKNSVWVLVPSLLGYTVILMCQAFMTPLAAYPDLFTLLNAAFSFGHFFGFLLLSYYYFFTV